jgi:hypothetical protein
LPRPCFVARPASGRSPGEGVPIGAEHEHAEVSILAPLPASSLVFINTNSSRLSCEIPGWASKLTEEVQRGLPPLFWAHVYGRFCLIMNTRLDLVRVVG